jgi:hypothetical protein
MHWNTIPDDERIRLWKKLRENIKDISIDLQLEQVAKFCSTMPFSSRTIDYYSSENWPTPWEILFHGTFCTSSISLLIFYTLALLPNKETVELFLVEDKEDIYLLPVVNNHYVLNYYLGEISIYSEVEHNFKVLKQYSQTDIKKIA